MPVMPISCSFDVVSTPLAPQDARKHWYQIGSFGSTSILILSEEVSVVLPPQNGQRMLQLRPSPEVLYPSILSSAAKSFGKTITNQPPDSLNLQGCILP